MATPFSTLYQKFLNKISDSEFASLLPDNQESIMTDFLESSIVRFRKCKKNLQDFDKTLQQFNVDLSLEEIEILALWMRFQWLEQQVYRIELARQGLSSKDYAMYSQANHIDALTKLRDSTESTVYKLMNFYSYDNNDLTGLKN